MTGKTKKIIELSPNEITIVSGGIELANFIPLRGGHLFFAIVIILDLTDTICGSAAVEKSIIKGLFCGAVGYTINLDLNKAFLNGALATCAHGLDSIYETVSEKIKTILNLK